MMDVLRGICKGGVQMMDVLRGMCKGVVQVMEVLRGVWMLDVRGGRVGGCERRRWHCTVVR